MNRSKLSKIIMQGGFLLMVLLGTLGQTGCKSGKEILEEKILTALEAKYEEPFVVESMGGNWAGGFPNKNTIQALCHPVADSGLKFAVEIQKDIYEVHDRYLNKLVGRNEEAYIQEIASEVWGESTVIATNDTVMTYPKENDKTMRYEEFLKLYPYATQMIDVFIKGEESVEVEVEIEKLESLTNKLVEKGYKSSLITITYIEPKTYEQISEIRQKEYTVYGYVNRMEKVYCITGTTIAKDGVIDFDTQTNVRNLEKYGRWGE